LSPEIYFIEKADGFPLTESYIRIRVEMASGTNFSGVREPGMLYNDYTGTWETLWLFRDQVLVRKRE
jgi:hypothetical protein